MGVKAILVSYFCGYADNWEYGCPPSIKHLPTPMSSGISCIDQIMSKIILSPAMVFSLLTFLSNAIL